MNPAPGTRPGTGIPRRWIALLILKPIVLAAVTAAALKYYGLW